ncbi:hypothetical protein B2J93_6623 [Marssonina coronariae]|uniref:Uncharacterized protein n=1 Tax=Diplocarpon coronariae TaxID=2795749 RepID=A0A218YUC8_9HELO|nr:hypothetical protein B2J93_6623 [Marssonina coronariae]
MATSTVTYGATSTTTLTTTVSLSFVGPSFTIFNPPPNTLPVQYTTFRAQSNLVTTYTPSPLPIFVLTNVVGIAINPDGSPLATRTLSQTAPSQSTSTSSPTKTCAYVTWSCLGWSTSKQALVGTAISVGGLLLILLLWWLFWWRPHNAKIRIKRGEPPPDIESGKQSTSVRIRSRIGTPRRENPEILSTSSPPPSRRRSGSIKIVASAPVMSEPPAYRVVPREFSASRMPAEERVDMSTSRDLDPTALPRTDEGGYRTRSTRESRNSREADISRPVSARNIGKSGGAKHREDPGPGGELKGRENEGRRARDEGEAMDRRDGQGHRGPDEENTQRRFKARVSRGYEEEHAVKRRHHSCNQRDEDGFDARRDRSPGRGPTHRDRDRRRPRSASPPPRERPRDHKKEQKNSEGSGLKKYLPLLPLVFGLLHTYAEPDGGWDQYIPEEKRKGKGKLKNTPRVPNRQTEHTTPLVDKALTEKKGTEEDLHGCHLEVEENNSRVIRHKGEVVTALRAHRRHLDADIPPEIVEEIGEGGKEDMMAPMTMIIVTM